MAKSEQQLSPLSDDTLDLVTGQWRAPDVLSRMHEPLRIKTPWQQQAELFMNGLEAQVREHERALQQDEQLAMICVQGDEKFIVHRISMPSANVVALHCWDRDGNAVQLTGHMNAVTFTFRVSKVQAPAKRTPIGFEAPHL